MATDRVKFGNRIKKYLDRLNKQNSYEYDTSVILQEAMEHYDSILTTAENLNIAKEYIKSLIPIYDKNESHAEKLRIEQEAELKKQQEAELQAIKEKENKAIKEIKDSRNPDLDKYFWQARELVKIFLNNDKINGLIFSGSAGLGKSYIIETEIPEQKLIKIQSHITPLELANVFYDGGKSCEGKVIYFDDVAGILKNPLCLPFYTKIKTSNGIKTLNELSEKDKVLSYNFKKNKREYKPFAKINTGLKSIVKIVTENKTYECSPEHKWFVFIDNHIKIIKAKDLNTKMLLLRLK